jgi:RibD C-terminal domain
LQVHGSGALIRSLLESDLVDEITRLIVPVVLGQGTRLFPPTGPDVALELVQSQADSKGVTVQVYRPSGRPQYSPNWAVDGSPGGLVADERAPGAVPARGSEPANAVSEVAEKGL